MAMQTTVRTRRSRQMRANVPSIVLKGSELSELNEDGQNIFFTGAL